MSSYLQHVYGILALDQAAYESAEMYVTGKFVSLSTARPSLCKTRKTIQDPERDSMIEVEHTIVAPHKRITIRPSHLAVHKLACALEGDVHVAVDGLQLACYHMSVSPNKLYPQANAYPCRRRQSSTSP